MKRRARGQSIVELALLLPFLVLFTLGTMELGYYVFTYSEMENATRRASEAASKTPPFTTQNCDDVVAPATRPGGCPVDGNTAPRDECAALIRQAAIDGILFSRLNASNFTTLITYPAGQMRQKGDQIQVEATYTGQWLSPIGRRFFGNTLQFRFTSRRTITSTRQPQGYNPDCTRNP